MKYLTIIFFFTAISINLKANEQSDIIILKSGQSYKLNVLEIFSWGLKLSNNLSCMYKQISTISTNDSILVNKMKRELPQTTVSQGESHKYILDLSKNIYEPREIISNRYFNQRSIQLLVGYGSTPNTEFRFTMEPSVIDNIILEFSYSLNWYSRGERKYTSYKPNFSLGLGAFKDLEYFRMSILAKYMNQTGDDVSLDSYLVSTNIQKNILGSIFLNMSWNYYFGGIKIRDNIQNSVLYLGLGFNIDGN
jgi:hypothetical protein